MKTLMILIAISLAGCTSLHTKAFEKIHEGDKSSAVIETLGDPDSFQASQRYPGAMAWYYKSGADTCGFTIQEETVKYMACSTDPSYLSPGRKALIGLGMGMQGMGEGLQNASGGNKNINCTSNTIGDQTYTNCH